MLTVHDENDFILSHSYGVEPLNARDAGVAAWFQKVSNQTAGQGLCNCLRCADPGFGK
jgi:hypothetical protein